MCPRTRNGKNNNGEENLLIGFTLPSRTANNILRIKSYNESDRSYKSYDY